jgi:hypothetical protein
MNGVVFDESKQRILDQMLVNSPFAAGNVMVMLFDTITTIGHADVLATLVAHEAAFTGYSRQSVLIWSPSALTADFHARAQGTTLSFTNSGGADSSLLTGWAMVDQGAGKVLQAGLYDTPFVIVAGQTYLTTPFWLYTGEIASEP